MNGNFSMMAKIAINKSILKEYKSTNVRTVYMNDGDEFQIQLFNPTQDSITARIRVNNDWMPYELLLKPGQRVWLERYMDKPCKMKFSTYEVGNSDIVKEAIRYNGDIYVEFRRVLRRRDTINISPISYTYITGGSIDSKYLNNNINSNYYSTLNDFSPINTSAINTSATLRGVDGQTTNLGEIRCSCTMNDDTPDMIPCSGTIENASYSLKRNDSLKQNDSFKRNETGRIEEGGYSSQDFEWTHLKSEYTPFNVAHFKILPMSQKPMTANDIKKIYCTNCGRKLNTKYKYCPYCGSRVD